MVRVQKWPFFQLFFFRQYRPEKCVSQYSRTKETPFYAIKTRTSKSRKSDVFPKGLTHDFGLKMAIFPPFFLGNIGRENVFYDILERKNAFLRYKNRKFKKQKNENFSKGVNPWFGSKNGYFSNFFFQPRQARKMSFRIFQNEKTPFYAIKSKTAKESKNSHFSKWE